MSEQLWYYIDGAQAQHGPITIPQLQALVASGMVTQSTIVWTEALGDQWIPASNVEGLFPETMAVVVDPNTASIAVKAPSANTDQVELASQIAQAAAPPKPTLLTPAVTAPAAAVVPAQAPAPSVAASVPEPVVASPAVPAPTLRSPDTTVETAQPAQQPQLAPTTPMIPSTPTTQPVAGTVAVSTPVPAQAAAPAVTPAATVGEFPNPVAAEVPVTKEKSALGLVLLVLGIVLAGIGGYLFSQEGGVGLASGVLAGGVLLVIFGFIKMAKGGASSPTVVTPVSGVGGYSALPSAPVGSFDVSSVADIKPIPAGTAAVDVKSNPLLSSSAVEGAATKASPFAGVNTATKPNPLLANTEAVKPQNKLNTNV